MTKADIEQNWFAILGRNILLPILIPVLIAGTGWAITVLNQLRTEMALSSQALIAVIEDQQELKARIAKAEAKTEDRTRFRFDSEDATRLELRLQRRIDDHETRVRKLEQAQ